MVKFDNDSNFDEMDKTEWWRQYTRFLVDHPEPKTYSLRQVDITHETLESASVADILQPVFQADCDWDTIEERDRKLAPLSVGQRRLYAVWWYEAQVRNDGHQMFYGNSYGMFWQEAVDGLDAIGAHSTKQILLDSIARFAEPPSRSRPRRNDQAEGLDFDDLDTRFYTATEDLEELMRDYMLAHADDFLFSGQLRYQDPAEFNCVYGRNGFRWELAP